MMVYHQGLSSQGGLLHDGLPSRVIHMSHFTAHSLVKYNVLQRRPVFVRILYMPASQI
jgi:hypothetical protein